MGDYQIDRRELVAGIGAAALLTVTPAATAAAMTDTRIALDPITWMTVKMTMDEPDPAIRREMRCAFSLPRQDSAYEGFDEKYRGMSVEEWLGRAAPSDGGAG